MSDVKAKMHQIVCRLGLCPRTRWGADSAPSWILGAYFQGREGKGEGTGGDPSSPVTAQPLHSR